MNRDQSYTLIRTTFTQGFDKTRFQNFTFNLLNHINERKAQTWNSTYVKDAFKNHVSRYERLGTYTSPDHETLDVLIVHLNSETTMARARTAMRNFVAHHLKTRDEKDAALVAFVSPSERQWRISYVKMEYATVEKESGKIGVETRLTPARRFSYIVGEGESCHTAQTRFLPLLQDTKTDPTLADIEEAFSVEAVTKEFFKRYVDLFENIYQSLDKIIKKDKVIHDEFQAKKINSIDFAKKLLGQIVFLYFLQKKGWLGVEKDRDWGTGPHDFLRRMAEGKYGNGDNYFNDLLEPLFYDTLAVDRGHEAWCKRFQCRIPFLNGGLFEPLGNYDWRKTEINIPNKLFTNHDFIEEGVIGTGVLDVFDRYNFTVNEAEPLEKEVAIDPEMLGKVFENLIEENRRKGLGAYYTPREIVHYMCQESLVNYLDTSLNKEKDQVPRKDIETFIHTGDQASHYESARMSGMKSYKPELPGSIETHSRLIDDKLKDITVCDPAVGSGAFPVGMMTEIIRARSSLTPYFNDIHERTPYFFKRHAIQNCLYGVDIDSGAVEIAKLRLWLSLVVDEEDVKQIKPLPNLDYKIVSGNSLLGVEKNLFNTELFFQLEKSKQQYFNETNTKMKAILKRQIDELIHKLTNAKETFDFDIYFSEIFQKSKGFDVIIANPPYVLLQDETNDPKLRKVYKEKFVVASYKIDLYHLFIEQGVRLLATSGTLVYITPANFLSNNFSVPLRRFLLTETSVKKIIIFENSVFDACVNNVVLSVQRTTMGITTFFRASLLTNGLRMFVTRELPQKEFCNADYLLIPAATNELSDIISKLQNQQHTLGMLASVNFGMQLRDRKEYPKALCANISETLSPQ
ncbi:MAG: N-6 DNA methylase [Deltaproteobacteria bacterium]|nr:N-6 DNA methylase [Deltaproteobacteria bacterium]